MLSPEEVFSHSVAKSCLTLCNPMDCSTPAFPVLHYLLEFVCSDSRPESVIPSNHLIFCCPLLILPSIFPHIRQSFPMSQLFASGGQSIGASASASILPMIIQGWFSLGFTSLISLLSKNSQESSPVPQFKSINSSVLSLLYESSLTSVHDYWKNQGFDYMNCCQQNEVSAS